MLQESYPLDEQIGAEGGLLLCRDTADPADLGLPPDHRVMSVVDFFRPDPTSREPALAQFGWSAQRARHERRKGEAATP